MLFLLNLCEAWQPAFDAEVREDSKSLSGQRDVDVVCQHNYAIRKKRRKRSVFDVLFNMQIDTSSMWLQVIAPHPGVQVGVAWISAFPACFNGFIWI